MANVYEVDPARHLFVDAVVGNGHDGFVQVTDPPSASVRGRLTRDLGPAGALVKTSLAVVASVTLQSAKDAVLTVDVYQKDATGAPTNKQTFKHDLPAAGSREKTGPRKKKQLSVDVAIS